MRGVMSAIFSVYDENMNVKKDTVKKLVDYHLDNGLTGFYVGGNTGECTVLPNKTRKQMLEAVVEYNNKRGSIIAHVGAGHLEDVYDLIDHANKMDIDAIASLPPSLSSYYDDEEIIEYYRLICERSVHPVIAYITPVLQGNILDFAKKLSKFDKIIGLKISIPNYYMFGEVVKTFGNRFTIFNGPDETMICGLAEGANGAIGTTYNILPKLAVSIFNNFNAGNVNEALKLQRKLNDFINIFLAENIADWKSVLTFLGFDMGYTVAPQRLPNSEKLANYEKQLEKINFKDLI